MNSVKLEQYYEDICGIAGEAGKIIKEQKSQVDELRHILYMILATVGEVTVPLTVIANMSPENLGSMTVTKNYDNTTLTIKWSKDDEI